MDDVVIEALHESIKHWERLASGKRKPKEYIGKDDCALCTLFNIDGASLQVRCNGCPVKEKTGQIFCRGTPFIEAESIAELSDDDNILDHEDFKNAAAKELEFLQSLLPSQK